MPKYGLQLMSCTHQSVAVLTEADMNSLNSCARMWTAFSLLSCRTQRTASDRLRQHYNTGHCKLNMECCGSWGCLHVPAFPFILGQLSVHSAHQSRCNWSAVSWLHLLLFHYKQDQAAAATHLGQWEMRSVKTQAAYGRQGQVTILCWQAKDWWNECHI